MLKKLKVLDLGFNELTELPSEMRQLSELHFLNISNNKLKVFPYWFQFLTKLKELYMEHNEIKFLPSILIKMKNLVKFNIAHNPIKSIPLVLLNLKFMEAEQFSSQISLNFIEEYNLPKKVKNDFSQIFNSINQPKILNYFQIFVIGNENIGKTTFFSYYSHKHKNKDAGGAAVAKIPPKIAKHNKQLFSAYHWFEDHPTLHMEFILRDFNNQNLLSNSLFNFFISESNEKTCFFVILFDARLPFDDIQEQLHYWILSSKENYPLSKIFLLGNIYDKEKFDKSQIPILQKQVEDFYSLPCFIANFKSTKSLKQFQSILVDAALSIVNHISNIKPPYPGICRLVENALEIDIKYFANQPALSFRAWINFILHCGCESFPEAELVTAYLSSRGKIIQLRNGDEEWIIISPKWFFKLLLAPPLCKYLTIKETMREKKEREKEKEAVEEHVEGSPGALLVQREESLDEAFQSLPSELRSCIMGTISAFTKAKITKK